VCEHIPERVVFTEQVVSVTFFQKIRLKIFGQILPTSLTNYVHRRKHNRISYSLQSEFWTIRAKNTNKIQSAVKTGPNSVLIFLFTAICGNRKPTSIQSRKIK
jgi:hypothetical protein